MATKENVVLVVDLTGYQESLFPALNTDLKIFTIVMFFVVMLFAICLIILASFL